MPVAVAVLMRLAAKTPSMSRHRIEGAISTLVNPCAPLGSCNRNKQDGLYYVLRIPMLYEPINGRANSGLRRDWRVAKFGHRARGRIKHFVARHTQAVPR